MNNKRNASLDNNLKIKLITTIKKRQIDLYEHKNIPSSFSSKTETETIISKLNYNKKNNYNKFVIKRNNNIQKNEYGKKDCYINKKNTITNNEKMLNNSNVTEKNENKNKIKSGAKSVSNLSISNNKKTQMTKETYNQKEKHINNKIHLNNKLIPFTTKNMLNVSNIAKTENSSCSTIEQKRKKLFHSFNQNYISIKTNDPENTLQKLISEENNEDSKYLQKAENKLIKIKSKKADGVYFKNKKAIKGNINNKVLKTLNQINTGQSHNFKKNHLIKLRINVSDNNISYIDNYYSRVYTCKNNSMSNNDHFFKIKTNDSFAKNRIVNKNYSSHILNKKLLNDKSTEIKNDTKNNNLKNKIIHKNSNLKNKNILGEDNNLEKNGIFSYQKENKKKYECSTFSIKNPYKQISKRMLRKQNYDSLSNENNKKIETNENNAAKKTIFQIYNTTENGKTNNNFKFIKIKKNNFLQLCDNNNQIKANNSFKNNTYDNLTNLTDHNKNKSVNINDNKDYQFLTNDDKFNDLLQYMISNSKEVQKEDDKKISNSSKTVNTDNLETENKNMTNNNSKKNIKKFRFVEKSSSKDKDLTQNYYELYKKAFNDTKNIEQKYSFKPKSKQSFQITNTKCSPEKDLELTQKYSPCDNNILIYKNEDNKKYHELVNTDRETNKSFILDLNNSIPIDEKALYNAFKNVICSNENHHFKNGIEEQKITDTVGEKIKIDVANDEKETNYNETYKTNKINTLHENEEGDIKNKEVSKDGIKICNLKKNSNSKGKSKINTNLNEISTKEKVKKIEKNRFIKNNECNRNSVKPGKKINMVIKRNTLIFDNSKIVKEFGITNKNSKRNNLGPNKYIGIKPIKNSIF